MKAVLFYSVAIFILTCGSTEAKLRHKRAWIIETLSIEEEHKGPFPYLLGPIGLEESFLMNYRGSGIDEDPKGVLSIDQYDGSVLVHKPVDYESHKFLQLNFEARDNEGDVSRLRVEIRILDINDNAPLFNPPHYETTVNESARQDQTITTVVAVDKDDPFTPNGTFNFRLVSVTPQTDNVEFYITQMQTTANIKFKGCLDYQKAQKYTLLIEAKDNGNKVQLSSTSTVVLHITDENNHVPVITGHTGSGKIKEHTTGVEVLRLQVSDEDSRGSPAWRAEYSLHGDNDHYFQITTDPQTNEGVLTVIKELDYEEEMFRNISITVQNQKPHFFCEFEDPPAKGPWIVRTGKKVSTTAVKHQVTISVENTNDPPVFLPTVIKVTAMENQAVGTVLHKLEAKDPDGEPVTSYTFIKGMDVANWLKVDPKTGQVSVAKLMDRESVNVVNGTYTVLMYVVNNDERSMTGTGTLIVQLVDENDNEPVLTVNRLTMCLSDEETRTPISAVDLDLPPYSYPFHYELLGDVEGKWRIEPTLGTTVNLIKGNTVYSNHYQLQIRISDAQDRNLVQQLNVTVCDCSRTPDCQARIFTRAGLGLSAVVVLVLTVLLLLASVLMTPLTCSRKKKILTIPNEDHFIPKSNFEGPGTEPSMLQNIKIQESQGAQYGAYRQESTQQTNGMMGMDLAHYGKESGGFFHQRW